MGLWLTVMYRNFFDECMIEDNISQSLQDTYKKMRKKLVTQMGLSYKFHLPWFNISHWNAFMRTKIAIAFLPVVIPKTTHYSRLYKLGFLSFFPGPLLASAIATIIATKTKATLQATMLLSLLNLPALVSSATSTMTAGTVGGRSPSVKLWRIGAVFEHFRDA
jgi:hypothetical protein